MPEFKIKVSEAQFKCLQFDIVDPKEWAENFITNRARISFEEIKQRTLTYIFDNKLPMPENDDEIVEKAYEYGVIKTLADVQVEHERQNAKLQKSIGSEQAKPQIR